MRRTHELLILSPFLFFLLPLSCHHYQPCLGSPIQRFNADGRFKILQIADMHYDNGGETECLDVFPSQYESCSDLNTTIFIQRLIALEKPDLIVFTGDNIFGSDTADPMTSMNLAFAPAIDAKIPWAAVLGNHDQESTLSRQEVMEYIVKLDYTLSQVYPKMNNSTLLDIDGFGNYHLEVKGALGSPFENKSVLNLYMIDSGDYSKEREIPGYGWIQESQKKWFSELTNTLKDDFNKDSSGENVTVPSLVYFHIPLVETRAISTCSIVGVKQESVGCAQVNSGFLSTMLEANQSFVIFNGHDHVNDFCGELATNIKVCYGGGVGYHAYGKAGWARRARIVSVELASNQSNYWLGVDRILTWKRLDSPSFPTIDHEILWPSRIDSRSHERCIIFTYSSILIVLLVLCISLFVVSCMMSRWPFKKGPITRRYTALPRIVVEAL